MNVLNNENLVFILCLILKIVTIDLQILNLLRISLIGTWIHNLGCKRLILWDINLRVRNITIILVLIVYLLLLILLGFIILFRLWLRCGPFNNFILLIFFIYFILNFWWLILIRSILPIVFTLLFDHHYFWGHIIVIVFSENPFFLTDVTVIFPNFYPCLELKVPSENLRGITCDIKIFAFENCILFPESSPRRGPLLKDVVSPIRHVNFSHISGADLKPHPVF